MKIHRTPSQRRAFRRTRPIAIGDTVRFVGATRILGKVIGFPTYSENMVSIAAEPGARFPSFDTFWTSLETVRDDR